MAVIRVTLDVAGLRRQISQVDRDLKGLGQGQPLKGVNQSFDNTTRSATRASGVFTDLKGIIATLVTAATLRQITGFANAFTEIENRVRAVVPAGQNLSGVIGALADVSRETGTQFEAVVSTFQRFTFATQALGLSQTQVIDLVETLNKGFRVYGATAQEAASVSLQLGQALASGTLQGDELRSVLEGYPPLVQAIADVMGIAAGEVKNFASEGKVSSEIVVEALQSIQDETDKAAEGLERTLGQATQGLRTSFIELAGVLDDTTGFTSGLVTVFDAMSEGMQTATEEAQQLSLELARAQTPLEKIQVLGQNVFQRIIDNIGELIVLTDDFTGSADDVSILDNRFGELATSILGVDGVFDTVISSAGDFLASISDFDGIGDIFAGLSDGGEIFVTTLRQVGADLVELGRQFLDFSGLSSVFDSFKEKLSEAGEAAGGLLDRFGDFTGLSSLFEPTSGAINNLGASFVEASGFGEGFGVVLADAGGSAEESSDKFSRFGDVLSDLGTSLKTVFIGTEEGSKKSREELAKLAGEIARVEVNLQDLSGGAGDYKQAAEDIAVVTKVTTEETKALDKQGKELAVTFRLLASGGRDAALAANEFEEGLDKLDKVFEDFEKETKQLEANFRSLADNVGGLFGLTGAEAEQFFVNFSNLLSGLSESFGVTFRGLALTIQEFLGVTTAQLDGFFGLFGKLLDGLGIEFEDVFGKKLTAIIQTFAQFTDNEITVIKDIFSGVTSAITDIGGTFQRVQASASSFFTAVSSGANTAAASLGPVGLALAGIGVIVAGTAAIFGAFGDRVQKIATVLAVAFAPFVFSIQLIIRLVQILRGSFDTLGAIGDKVGKALAIVFAPVLIPLRLIVEAVQFLIGLFTNLGSVGDTVAKLLAVVLAPIVIPIRIIIEAIQFLIGLFSSLGNAGQVLRDILSAAFGAIGAVFNTVFSAMRALGTAVFAALQAAGAALQAALSAIFNAIGAVFGAVFRAIQALATAVFGAILAVARAAFAAINAVIQAFQSVFSNIFGSLGGIAQAAFGAVVAAGQAAFSALISIAQQAASAIGGILGGISASISGIAGALTDLSNSASSIIGGIGDTIGIGKPGTPASRLNDEIKFIRNFIAQGRSSGLSDAEIRSQLLSNPNVKLFRGSAIDEFFAKGGVINGPTVLDGPGLAGKAFAAGTVLNSPTLLGSGNVTPTSRLGLAGESGPEGILPLAETSRGLGVTATGLGGTNTRIFIIHGVDRKTTDKIEESVAQLNAEVEFRSAQAAQQLLLGAL